MNFWEFLSQPVAGTPEEYETFWEGVNRRKELKNKKQEINYEEHKHVHFHFDEIEKRKEKIQQLQQEIEELKNY